MTIITCFWFWKARLITLTTRVCVCVSKTAQQIGVTLDHKLSFSGNTAWVTRRRSGSPHLYTWPALRHLSKSQLSRSFGHDMLCELANDGNQTAFPSDDHNELATGNCQNKGGTWVNERSVKWVQYRDCLSGGDRGQIGPDLNLSNEPPTQLGLSQPGPGLFECTPRVTEVFSLAVTCSCSG